MENGNSKFHNNGSLDTLAQAQNVNPAEGAASNFESEAHETYTVSALEDDVVQETAENGETTTSVTTLWVHCRSRWYWDFFSYKSDSWVWITDSQNGGKLVKIDRVEANLVHNSHYGTSQKVEKNSSSAHAKARIFGVAVAKVGICAWGCVENSGIGRWCTAQSCN